MAQFYLGISVLCFGFVPIAYAYLAIKFKGSMRLNSLFIFAGFMIHLTGNVIITEGVVNSVIIFGFNYYFLFLFSPILKIVGLLLVAKGYNIKYEE